MSMLAQALVGIGGMAAILVTPVFALSYFGSYGLPEEAPPGWLAGLQPSLTNLGFLHAGDTGAYDRYGLLYLTCWVVALAGLVGLLKRPWSEFTRRRRRAWGVLVTDTRRDTLVE